MVLPLSLAACLGAAACDSDKPVASDAGAADAGPNQALMDKNIAEAVASAAAPGAQPGNPAGGPPPNGVFAPGMADQAHALGKPVAVELIEAGAEPRQVLTGAYDLTKPSKLRLTISRSLPGGVMPNVDFTLRAQAPKEEAAVEPAPAADAGVAAGKPRPVVFTVLEASPSSEQPGRVPAELGKVLETLVGSKIHAVLAPDGSISDERAELGKDVQPPMDEFAHGLEDALGLFMSPLPSKPVGVGAYWIASDRTEVAGMKVVRYRVTKLEQLLGEESAFSVDVRMYLIDDKQKPDIAQGEAVAMGFAAQGKGAWTARQGALWPTSGQLQMPFVIQLATAQQPQRAMPLQFETRAVVVPASGGKPPAP